MRILSIVGARPQFVKLAVIAREISCTRPAWTHRIVHTGQHYDPSLSSVFFEEMNIPRPDFDLEVGSGPHGAQTGEMLKRIEPVLEGERPDWVLLYGDTNSTLAGALAAAKLGLNIAHIEAGLRSYRRSMPEEINRVVADHLSQLLLCPTQAAVENLAKEGLGDRARLTGDVMCDALKVYREAAESRPGPLGERWQPRTFALATVHRAENTDDPERLDAIVNALEQIASNVVPVVWPVHPRTRSRLSQMRPVHEALTLIDPLSYSEMLLMEGRARFILTDSGGVQKEAYMLHVPCITLREETEWQETLANGCNILTGADRSRIVAATQTATSAGPWTNLYGDGHASRAILCALAGEA